MKSLYTAYHMKKKKNINLDDYVTFRDLYEFFDIFLQSMERVIQTSIHETVENQNIEINRRLSLMEDRINKKIQSSIEKGGQKTGKKIKNEVKRMEKNLLNKLASKSAVENNTQRIQKLEGKSNYMMCDKNTS